MQRLQELLSKNGALKAAAVALALLLWAAVRVDAPAERTFQAVPVEVRLADEDWTVRGQPSPVTVRFTGATRDLLPLSRANTHVVVPIEVVTSGDTTVVIEREWIREGARTLGPVSDITPSAIRLQFDRVETREAPVRVTTLGALREGFALAAAPQTVPRMVRMRGSAEALGAVRDLPLEPVALEGFQEPTTVTRAVDLGGLEGISVQPDSVSVVFAIEERVERSFHGVPVQFRGPRLDTPPTVDTVSVAVSGARSVVQRLTAEALRVTASQASSDADSTTWTVEVTGVPEWVAAEPSVLAFRFPRSADR